MVIFWSMICVGRLLVFLNFPPYILKANKFAEPPFQSKKLRKKCVNPGVIFGPFEVILSHFWAILGHFGSYLVHFGQFWVIFGYFWAISWHFWTNLWKVQFFCGSVGVVGLAFRMYDTIS